MVTRSNISPYLFFPNISIPFKHRSFSIGFQKQPPNTPSTFPFWKIRRILIKTILGILCELFVIFFYRELVVIFFYWFMHWQGNGQVCQSDRFFCLLHMDNHKQWSIKSYIYLHFLIPCASVNSLQKKSLE